MTDTGFDTGFPVKQDEQVVLASDPGVKRLSKDWKTWECPDAGLWVYKGKYPPGLVKHLKKCPICAKKL